MLKCLADVPSPTLEEMKAFEARYRKGYCHGYSQAIDDMKRFGFANCARHYDGALSDWRWGDKLAQQPAPSCVKQKKTS